MTALCTCDSDLDATAVGRWENANLFNLFQKIPIILLLTEPDSVRITLFPLYRFVNNTRITPVSRYHQPVYLLLLTTWLTQPTVLIRPR